MLSSKTGQESGMHPAMVEIPALRKQSTRDMLKSVNPVAAADVATEDSLSGAIDR